MAELINKILEFKNELNTFYLSGITYIPNDSDDLRRMFDEINQNTKPIDALNNLYHILDVLFLVISEKQDSASTIANTHIVKNVKLGEFYKKLDLFAHEHYTLAKSNITMQSEQEVEFRKTTRPYELYELLKIRNDLFDSVDPTYMMPTENYTQDPPKNAKIVTFAVKNTQNLLVNIKNIVDSRFAKYKFPNVTNKSGVNSETIERYSIIKIYPKVTPVEEEIISKTDKVYQKITDNLFRELVHYPSYDYVRNIDFMPINNFLINFENKRIMLAKRTDTTEGQEVAVDNSLPGEIKQKFMQEKKRLDDAIFAAAYKPEMTDEEVLKLGMAAQNIQDSVPRNVKILETKFDSFVNTHTLKKVF